MQAEERQQRIAEFVQSVEFASLEEIAGKVDASVSTVRREPVRPVRTRRIGLVTQREANANRKPEVLYQHLIL